MPTVDDQVLWNTSDSGSENNWTAVTHPNVGLNDSTSQVPIFREGSACVDGQISVAAGTWTEDITTGTGNLSNGIRANKLYVIWLWMTSSAAYDSTTDILVGINDTAAWGGTAWGQWDMKPLFQSLDRGGWVPCAVYPTQPDASGAGFGSIALNSIDSQRIDIDNSGGGAVQIRLFGIEQSFAISYLGGHSQTVTLDNLVTHSKDKTGHQDSGMVNNIGDAYRSQVVLRLGDAAATALTTFAETAKVVHFDNVNTDHEIGFDFINDTGGDELHFQLGDFLGNSPVGGMFMFWNDGASDVFIGSANCDKFRIYAGTFLRAGPIELPPHVTSKGSVADLVTIGAGGTGYTVGDDLTATSGTGTKATFNVDTVSSGAVTAVTQLTEGDYTVDPTNPSATTVVPSGGTGATLNITTQFFKECKGYTFDTCGEVDIGDLTFEDNKILNSVSGVLYSGTGTRRASNNQYIGCTDALHFDTAQTITLDGDTFSGNTTDIHFSGTGTLTVNLSGGANPTTSRVSGGGTVTINPPSVTTTITVLDSRDGSVVENVRVLVEASSGAGDLDFDTTVTITRVTTTATVAHTAHPYIVGDEIAIRFAAQQEYNGVRTITAVATNTYDYTVSGSPATPATIASGKTAIESNGVVIDGLTNVSGTISDTRPWTLAQPVKGVARLSTTSPRFKSAPILGTISTTTGLNSTVQLIIDE